jgi:hypothetical protein
LESKKETLRAKSLSKQCSFQPEIGPLNRELGEKYETPQQFLQRMLNSKVITQQEIEEKRQQLIIAQQKYELNGHIVGKLILLISYRLLSSFDL